MLAEITIIPRLDSEGERSLQVAPQQQIDSIGKIELLMYISEFCVAL